MRSSPILLGNLEPGRFAGSSNSNNSINDKTHNRNTCNNSNHDDTIKNRKLLSKDRKNTTDSNIMNIVL